MLAVTSGVMLLSVLVWFNYPAVLPLVVEDWGLSGAVAGLIFGAFQAGYLLAVIPAGAVADRHSPRWIIGVGAAGTGLASLGFAVLATGPVSGIVLRGVAGAFMAGVYVPGMRFLSDWYPERARGRALGLYVGTLSVGSGLAYLLGSSIAEATDWRVAIAATSVGALLAAPAMVWLTRDHPGTAARTGGVAWEVLRNRSYLAAVSVYSWHNWELFGVRNWIVAFLVATPAVAATGSTALAGTIAGAMIAIGGIGNALGGSLSDRLGRSRVIALALASSGLLSLLIGGLGWLPLPALVGIVFVYGVALTADSAPTSTAVTELVDDEHVGTALSLQSFVGFTTTVVSPVVFGAAVDAGGYELAFPTLAAGAALGLASALVLRRTQRAEGAGRTSRPA